MSRRRGTTRLDTTQINEWGESEDGLVVAGDAPDGRRLDVRWDDRAGCFMLEYKVGGRRQTIEIGPALAESLSMILGARL